MEVNKLNYICIFKIYRDMKNKHLSEKYNSIDSINGYYNNLGQLLSGDAENYEFNFDHSHNSVVVRFMLENASSVCMYCGRMSVFSKRFYDEIATKDSDLSSHLLKKMKDVLTDYIVENKSMLRVVLEKAPENDDFLDSLIIDKKMWLDAIRDQRVEISYLPEYLYSKKMLNHFSFTEDGRISRFEQDKEKHSAVCTLNPKDRNKYLAGAFKKLKKFSLPYSPEVGETK